MTFGCLPFVHHPSGKWGKSRKHSEEVHGVEIWGEGWCAPQPFYPVGPRLSPQAVLRQGPEPRQREEVVTGQRGKPNVLTE